MSLSLLLAINTQLTHKLFCLAPYLFPLPKTASRDVSAAPKSRAAMTKPTCFVHNKTGESLENLVSR